MGYHPPKPTVVSIINRQLVTGHYNRNGVFVDVRPLTISRRHILNSKEETTCKVTYTVNQDSFTVDEQYKDIIECVYNSVVITAHIDSLEERHQEWLCVYTTAHLSHEHIDIPPIRVEILTESQKAAVERDRKYFEEVQEKEKEYRLAQQMRKELIEKLYRQFPRQCRRYINDTSHCSSEFLEFVLKEKEKIPQHRMWKLTKDLKKYVEDHLRAKQTAKRLAWQEEKRKKG